MKEAMSDIAVGRDHVTKCAEFGSRIYGTRRLTDGVTSVGTGIDTAPFAHLNASFFLRRTLSTSPHKASYSDLQDLVRT